MVFLTIYKKITYQISSVCAQVVRNPRNLTTNAQTKTCFIQLFLLLSLYFEHFSLRFFFFKYFILTTQNLFRSVRRHLTDLAEYAVVQRGPCIQFQSYDHFCVCCENEKNCFQSISSVYFIYKMCYGAMPSSSQCNVFYYFKFLTPPCPH